MGVEDLDLGWRLREAGWATRFEPRAVVDHESAAATTQLFGPEVAPHWQRSTYGFLARRRGVAYTWVVALLNFVERFFDGPAACLSVKEPDPHAEVRRAHARWRSCT